MHTAAAIIVLHRPRCRAPCCRGTAPTAVLREREGAASRRFLSPLLSLSPPEGLRCCGWGEWVVPVRFGCLSVLVVPKYRWPNGLPGTARPTRRTVLCQPTVCTHGPVRLGPCRASPKARQFIVLLHRISLCILPKLCGLCPYGWKVSLFCIPLLSGLCLIWLINSSFTSLYYFFPDRAMPGRPTVLGSGPSTARLSGQVSTSTTPEVKCGLTEVVEGGLVSGRAATMS